jgi:hypothetical protein
MFKWTYFFNKVRHFLTKFSTVVTSQKSVFCTLRGIQKRFKKIVLKVMQNDKKHHVTLVIKPARPKNVIFPLFFLCGHLFIYLSLILESIKMSWIWKIGKNPLGTFPRIIFTPRTKISLFHFTVDHFPQSTFPRKNVSPSYVSRNYICPSHISPNLISPYFHLVSNKR